MVFPVLPIFGKPDIFLSKLKKYRLHLV